MCYGTRCTSAEDKNGDVGGVSRWMNKKTESQEGHTSR